MKLGHMYQQDKVRDLLREIRADAGLTQVELAQRLGRTQSYVSKYESGELQLNIIELRELCSVTGVLLLDFIQRLENALNET